MPKSQGIQFLNGASDGSAVQHIEKEQFTREQDSSSEPLSPTLSRLLDVLVILAQSGPSEATGSSGGKSSKSHHSKGGHHSRNHLSSSEKGSGKVRDLEAIQMLQDIFLKANSVELQAEVLNRLFKIFSSHPENYKLCQELKPVRLFILNMHDFPPSLQEIILKILEYAVTVANCIPEQELLSLCWQLQRDEPSELKYTILSFFVKLLSFDKQYKKVLREVGVLEVLLDDLKQHKFLLGPDHQSDSLNNDQLVRKSSSGNFKKHLDGKDVIITSPKCKDSGSKKFLIFEVESTVGVAWDCMVSLLKEAEANQSSFRSASGLTIILPFLACNIHRSGVLRVLSCLITEDVRQVCFCACAFPLYYSFSVIPFLFKYSFHNDPHFSFY